MLVFQAITLIFVKEEKIVVKKGEKTHLLDIFRIIGKNDQLLTVTIAMLFFMAAYITTTGLGIYYFKYVYGNEDMYSIFALVLGVSQIIGLLIFPFLSNKMNRKTMFTLGIVLVLVGYISFFLSPKNMIPIAISGVFIFAGEAFIQLLMLMFISDTVEYGQWKFGNRNDSITSSVQPLIYKCSNAISSLIIPITLVLTGIQEQEEVTVLKPSEELLFKSSMLVIPIIAIIISYFIMKKWYKIDENFYEEILTKNFEMEE